MIVYLLTNTANGTRYVGKTVRSLKVRWSSHCYASQKGSTTYLHNAIRKYGAEVFTATVLSVALSEDVLNRLERFWIRELNTHNPGGYNLSLGGEGQTGYSHSLRTRKNMSLFRRGRKKDIEMRKKLLGNKHALGYRQSEEQRDNTRQRTVGKQWALGYCHTPETRAKISAANLGNKHSLGVRPSAETRAKMSAAQRRRYGHV